MKNEFCIKLSINKKALVILKDYIKLQCYLLILFVINQVYLTNFQLIIMLSKFETFLVILILHSLTKFFIQFTKGFKF